MLIPVAPFKRKRIESSDFLDFKKSPKPFITYYDPIIFNEFIILRRGGVDFNYRPLSFSPILFSSLRLDKEP